MFVPGVNGSIIANSNAPTGSKLKGAYKNSKKRKMPNGGVNVIPALRDLDPNFNKPKNTVNPLVKDALASANVATGMLSLGHFSPDPLAQTAALVGDISGALVDVAQSGVDLYEDNNVNAAANIGTAITPLALKNKGYYRSRSLVGGTSPGKYRPISPLNSTQGANPAIKKGLNWNKAILAANVIDMGQNISSSNNNTMRVPQRDNTQVFMRPNPNLRRMANGGTLPPIYTANPRDPRIGRYNDSLNSYNLAPSYNKQILTNLQKATTVKGGFQANLKTNEEFQKRGLNYQLGFNRKEFPKKTVSDGYVGAIKYEYKKPVQPYIYRKPEVTPEVVESPTPSAPAVSPEQPVKKIGYNKPIIQQFNYMSNENKAKALQKYGSVSDIPFQGVDINQLKNGGKISNDKQMVDGVAGILHRVESKSNRLKLANQLSKQFNREKVKYDLSSFLAKSKVKK